MVASSNPEQARQPGLLRFAPLFIAAIIVSLYLTHGIDRSLWLDEANTAFIANGSLRKIITGLSNDASPPFYYFLLSGWTRLFGQSELSLRLPSIVFYLSGIYVMWLLGRRLLGPEGAGLAAFIYAINPVVGRHAQNVRMYTLLALIVCLSLLVFFMFVSDTTRRTPIWFGLFGISRVPISPLSNFGTLKTLKIVPI
jgi:uncharacterized membrane protein